MDYVWIIREVNFFGIQGWFYFYYRVYCGEVQLWYFFVGKGSGQGVLVEVGIVVESFEMSVRDCDVVIIVQFFGSWCKEVVVFEVS